MPIESITWVQRGTTPVHNDSGLVCAYCRNKENIVSRGGAFARCILVLRTSNGCEMNEPIKLDNTLTVKYVEYVLPPGMLLSGDVECCDMFP